MGGYENGKEGKSEAVGDARVANRGYFSRGLLRTGQ